MIRVACSHPFEIEDVDPEDDAMLGKATGTLAHALMDCDCRATKKLRRENEILKLKLAIARNGWEMDRGTEKEARSAKAKLSGMRLTKREEKL